MSWILLRILFMLCLLQQVGCVQFKDRIDDCAIKAQDKKITKNAWASHVSYWESEPHLEDFRKGFKAGYYAALNGEDCPPAIPPKFYWSARNAGPDSEARTNAWFNGWWVGSVAANSDGLFDHREIHIAPRLSSQSGKSKFDWSDVSSSNDYGAELIPVPDLPDETQPGSESKSKSDKTPFVPPAIEPKKTPGKEYSPDTKKKI